MSPTPLPVLHVVTVSTRQGRKGPALAHWFSERASAHGAFTVEAVDLREVALPLFDEESHPRFGRYEHPHTQRWAARVKAADAFVFVTPEYNHGPPPSLLNALAYLSAEWAYKPVGFVSYGGVSAGTRGVELAKMVVTTLKMMPIPEAVAFPMFTQHLEGDVFRAPEAAEKSATAMLTELARWAAALRTLR